MTKISVQGQGAGDRANLAALELLSISDMPVGNQTLVAALREVGIVVAEATAGRILRKLVSQGLARTLGKRGRVLTPAGRVKLASLKDDQLRFQRSVRLLKASTIEDIESLRDMLLVRRAIEPEAARLAAMRANEADIELLDKFTCAHCMASVEGGQRVDPAISFHSQLLRASHHALLMEMGLLVVEQTNTSLLDQISHNPAMTLTREEVEQSAREFAADHERITDAIRHRDADLAERAMRVHIDRLLAQTAAYIDVIATKSPGTGTTSKAGKLKMKKRPDPR